MSCDAIHLFPCPYILINVILLDVGFRSRVKYISVLDPTVRCYYVSEVLDARQAGPLFMVSRFIFSIDTFILVILCRNPEITS